MIYFTHCSSLQGSSSNVMLCNDSGDTFHVPAEALSNKHSPPGLNSSTDEENQCGGSLGSSAPCDRSKNMAFVSSCKKREDGESSSSFERNEEGAGCSYLHPPIRQVESRLEQTII